MSETHEETVDVEPIEVEEETQPGGNLPAVVQHEAIVARSELSVEEVIAQKGKINEVMDGVMRRGVHYGTIPGINKPTLLKPGAEAINVALRLAPHYTSEKIFRGEHLTVVTNCELRHITSGLVVGTGEGLCTTFESKYRWRTGRTCPTCGAGTIKRSKFRDRDNPEAEPGWYCHAKVGGCGAQFYYDEASIVAQSDGRVENPDLPDTWNTVVKMSAKRALVAATLNATAASDVFTQDVEDQAAAADPADEAGSAPARGASGPTLVPGALQVKSMEIAQQLREQQAAFATDLNWDQIEEELCGVVFGKGRNELSPGQTGEFWIRLANSVEITFQMLPAPELGALDEQIAHGYGLGFGLEEEIVLEAIGHAKREDPEQTTLNGELTKDEEAAAEEAANDPSEEAADAAGDS